MAVLADTRLTILQILNEVNRKLGVPAFADLTSTDAQTFLDYLNDIIAMTSDYGDWQEARTTHTVTASSSVNRYLVNPSAAVKNIEEIAFEDEDAAMRLATIEQMRRWHRTSGTGSPRHWVINGVDNITTGQPYIDVYPQPGTNENNKTFDILYYKKPPLYTSSDGAVVPCFPSRLLVSGLLAMALLDESRGTQNIDFLTQFRGLYDPMMEEAFNRLNGDSGGDTQFVPTRNGFRRS